MLRSAKIVSEATIEDIRAGWEKFAASFVARNAVSDGEHVAFNAASLLEMNDPERRRIRELVAQIQN